MGLMVQSIGTNKKTLVFFCKTKIWDLTQKHWFSYEKQRNRQKSKGFNVKSIKQRVGFNVKAIRPNEKTLALLCRAEEPTTKTLALLKKA